LVVISAMILNPRAARRRRRVIALDVPGIATSITNRHIETRATVSVPRTTLSSTHNMSNDVELERRDPSPGVSEGEEAKEIRALHGAEGGDEEIDRGQVTMARDRESVSVEGSMATSL
jgi:hypothetical protein